MAAKPPAPDWLPERARAEWVRIWPRIADREPDLGLVERYVVAYATWRQSEEKLTRSDRVIVIRDDKGNVKSVGPSPWVTIGDKARAEMSVTSRMLGL